MLETGLSRTLDDGVFVGHDRAVALLAETEWKAEEVRAALATAAETGPLGRIVFEARGRTLSRVESSSIVVRDAGRAVTQTVVYRFGQ